MFIAHEPAQMQNSLILAILMAITVAMFWRALTWKVPSARDGQDSRQAQSSQVKGTFSYQEITLG
jgi:hypothetical protein